MSKSLKQVASEMDPLAAKGTKVLLSSVLRQHRFPVGFPVSGRGLREIVRRHTGPITVKFLSYNTFLTEAHVSLPDPFPDLRITAKPALHGRAAEIGRRIFSEYDFAALYEVMQDKQRDEILAAWGPAPPDSHFAGTLTSLFAISKKFRIGRKEGKTYISKGKGTRIRLILVPVPGIGLVPLPTPDTGVGVGVAIDLSLDSDFYAHKGVLLTEILTPLGAIEVFSTHLFFGGGVGKTAEDIINVLTPFEQHISESTPAERFETQKNELNEMLAFYRVHHRPQNVAIFCGDLNIDGSEPAHFNVLKNLLASINMKDVWAEGPFPNNLKGGQTSRNDDDDTKPDERDFANICTGLAANGDYCDDSRPPNHRPPPDAVGRFDYLFVENPQPSHNYNLDLTRVRRRQFHWSQPADGQFFLSDHLGLETTLLISRK
jgi:endonuclease/exonuclease/phosphatase family metal-dependent hydrolase